MFFKGKAYYLKLSFVKIILIFYYAFIL